MAPCTRPVTVTVPVPTLHAPSMQKSAIDAPVTESTADTATEPVGSQLSTTRVFWPLVTVIRLAVSQLVLPL